LYVVETSGGSPRKVVDGDAAQPFWSPSGRHLVYWSNTTGQRDIFVVDAAGGTRVPLTQDPAIDWSPVWSPDGRFVYFASDRGGAMNLWRIAVDPSTGRPHGAPEAVTAGVQASAGLPRFSKDGSRLAFRSRIASVNPVAIPFDPATNRAGTPFVLDTRNSIRVPSDVSADGKQIAYFSIADRQEDLFIGAPDGPMRRVTDDAARDRAPVFTPDERSLVFYSNRDGSWGIWTIDLDGSNLRQIAKPDAGAIYPLISSKSDRVVFTADRVKGLFSIPFGSVAGSHPTQLSGATTGGRYLVAIDWSPDGSRLTGYLIAVTGRPTGVGVYDLAAQTTTMVSTDDAFAPKWLADGRRIAYFTKSGSELVVLDTVTRKRTVVDVRLPGPSTDDVFAISPDNRMIYYGAARAEADIWIVERKDTKN
jgi:eukaryotic-like serine/threonine-protein kinase